MGNVENEKTFVGIKYQKDLNKATSDIEVQSWHTHENDNISEK